MIRPRLRLGVGLLLAAAVSMSGCGSDTAPQAAPGSTPPASTASASAASASPAPSTTADPPPTLTAAEEAAWQVYPAHYFDRFNLISGLYGDDFGTGPLTEVIGLCGTEVAPASRPVTARRAISVTGGGLSEQDRGTVTRSVAVYRTESDATTMYATIQTGLAACRAIETPKITALPVAGALGWQRTGYRPLSDHDTTGNGVLQIWTATRIGRAVLIQYASLSSSEGLARAGTIATTLHASADRLRSEITQKLR